MHKPTVTKYVLFVMKNIKCVSWAVVWGFFFFKFLVWNLRVILKTSHMLWKATVLNCSELLGSFFQLRCLGRHWDPIFSQWDNPNTEVCWILFYLIIARFQIIRMWRVFTNTLASQTISLFSGSWVNIEIC